MSESTTSVNLTKREMASLAKVVATNGGGLPAMWLPKTHIRKLTKLGLIRAKSDRLAKDFQNRIASGSDMFVSPQVHTRAGLDLVRGSATATQLNQEKQP